MSEALDAVNALLAKRDEARQVIAEIDKELEDIRELLASKEQQHAEFKREFEEGIAPLVKGRW